MHMQLHDLIKICRRQSFDKQDGRLPPIRVREFFAKEWAPGGKVAEDDGAPAIGTEEGVMAQTMMQTEEDMPTAEVCLLVGLTPLLQLFPRPSTATHAYQSLLTTSHDSRSSGPRKSMCTCKTENLMTSKLFVSGWANTFRTRLWSTSCRSLRFRWQVDRRFNHPGTYWMAAPTHETIGPSA